MIKVIDNTPKRTVHRYNDLPIGHCFRFVDSSHYRDTLLMKTKGYGHITLDGDNAGKCYENTVVDVIITPVILEVIAVIGDIER